MIVISQSMTITVTAYLTVAYFLICQRLTNVVLVIPDTGNPELVTMSSYPAVSR